MDYLGCRWSMAWMHRCVTWSRAEPAWIQLDFGAGRAPCSWCRLQHKVRLSSTAALAHRESHGSQPHHTRASHAGCQCRCFLGSGITGGSGGKAADSAPYLTAWSPAGLIGFHVIRSPARARLWGVTALCSFSSCWIIAPVFLPFWCNKLFLAPDWICHTLSCFEGVLQANWWQLGGWETNRKCWIHSKKVLLFFNTDDFIGLAHSMNAQTQLNQLNWVGSKMYYGGGFTQFQMGFKQRG